jgi:glutathione S-transferase
MRRTGVGFVPVLITPEDEMLQDTTDIIDAVEARIPDPPLLPSATDGVVCRLFEVYADEFFPIVSMRTRWAYPENESEARRVFASFTGSVDMANTMADRLRSALPMLGVTPATLPAIDAHLDAMLSALCSHFSAHRFVLGERMSLADCALMGPLYAHLYLDRFTRKKPASCAEPRWSRGCGPTWPGSSCGCATPSGRFPSPSCASAGACSPPVASSAWCRTSARPASRRGTSSWSAPEQRR